DTLLCDNVLPVVQRVDVHVSITPSSGMPVSLLQISVIPLNIFNGSFSTSVSESRHSLILAEAVYAGNMPLGFSIKVVTPLNSVFSVSSSSTSTVKVECGDIKLFAVQNFPTELK